MIDLVTQWVEYYTFNVGVASSSLAGDTIYIWCSEPSGGGTGLSHQ